MHEEGAVSGSVRVWLRAEGSAVLGLSLTLYGQLGYRWGVFAVLLLVPDLIMLGYLLNARVGAMSYNVVHSYVLPLALMGFAMITARFFMVSLLCIWMAHVGMDRMLGFGLKYPSGFTSRTSEWQVSGKRTELVRRTLSFGVAF